MQSLVLLLSLLVDATTILIQGASLAMLGVGQANKDELSAGLKHALDELRNLIDSLDPLTNEIPFILAIVRERFEPPLR